MGLALVLVTALPALAVNPFPDVSSSSPYYASVVDLASRGLIFGYDDGSFGPDDPVTRQQFAKMVAKVLGLPVTGTEVSPFSDVPAAPYGAADPLYPDKYVAVCVAQGWIEPKTETAFGPMDELSRATLVSFAARAMNPADPPAGYNPPFDAFEGEDYEWARKAAYAGLLSGVVEMGPDYDLTADISRGECAQVLHNLVVLTGLPVSATASTVPTAPGTTAATSPTAPVTQPSAGTSLSPATSTPASLAGSAVEEGPALLRPQMIVVMAAGVLAILAAAFLLVRRFRPRKDGPVVTLPAASATAGSASHAAAVELLREWDEMDQQPPAAPLEADTFEGLDLEEEQAEPEAPIDAEPIDEIIDGLLSSNQTVPAQAGSDQPQPRRKPEPASTAQGGRFRRRNRNPLTRPR